MIRNQNYYSIKIRVDLYRKITIRIKKRKVKLPAQTDGEITVVKY